MIFGEFLGFLEILVEFSDFFCVVGKVTKFGHSGSTGKIGILGDFWGFLSFLRIFEDLC
jgi:hypothetical protein